MVKRLSIFFFVVAFLCNGFTETKASHVAAVNITYLGVDTFSYVVTVKVFRDCRLLQGVPTNLTINYNSVSCALSGFVSINLVPNQGDSTGNAGTGVFVQLPCLGIDSCDTAISGYAVEEFTYQGTVTLPDTCVDWILSAEPPGFRNASDVLVNATTKIIYVSALLNNVDAPANNSPTFQKPPVAIFCVGNQFFFNQGAIESDGDSLVYSLAQAQGGGGSLFNYNPGFDYLTPFNVIDSPLVMDPLNGIISFTPDSQPVSNFTSVINVLIQEYNANGILIGSVKNDMQVFISDSCDSDTLNFTGDTTTATGIHPAISAYCKASRITVHFDFPIQCETIALDGSNFTVTLPIGGTLPISSIDPPTCSFGLIDSVTLVLSDSLRYNGSYFVYDTIGSNGTRILSECGLPLNDTLEVRLRNCVKAIVDLLNVTVVNNDRIHILWTVYTENFSDSDSVSIEYNVLRSLNPMGAYNPVGSSFLILDTFYTDYNVYVTDTAYNYMMDMLLDSLLYLYPRTDSIQSILLTGVESTFDTTLIDLSWTRYWGWPNVTYRVLESIDNDAWVEIGTTPSSVTTFTYTKPLLAATYRIMIRTIDGVTNLRSESNWIEYQRAVMNIPNVITPNEDGVNDFFFVNELLLYQPVHFIVYDRWGVKVFEDDDYDNKWDGDNLRGRSLAEGTYFYVLSLTGAESRSGFVVIIR